MKPDLAPTGSSPDPFGRAGREAAVPTISEDVLLARMRAGDAAAFETWVRAETPRVLGTLRRILRSEEDARDAAQEAFLNAYRALDRFAGGSRLSTWLHRIAINAALMHLRRQRRRGEESIDDLLPRFHEDGHRVDPGAPWPERTEELFERRELREILEQCYERLPEAQRVVVLLRDVEGLSTAETAAVLGIGGDAVKMRLHRARQALRTLLEPYVVDGIRPAGPR